MLNSSSCAARAPKPRVARRFQGSYRTPIKTGLLYYEWDDGLAKLRATTLASIATDAEDYFIILFWASHAHGTGKVRGY